jgi:hypothetical protein
MGLLSRDAILAAQDGQFEDVECPEWGGTVRIRALTGRQRDEFECYVSGTRRGSKRLNLDNLRAKLVSMTAVDEAGVLLFSAADAYALGDKAARVLDRLVEVAQRLAGLSEADVEELVEDFGAAPSGVSSTV